MPASDALAGKRQCPGRPGGQGLRHRQLDGFWLKCSGIKAVIPPKSNRKEKNSVQLLAL